MHFIHLTLHVINLQLAAHITPPSSSSTLGAVLAEEYSSTLHVTQPRTVFLLLTPLGHEAHGFII